MAVIDELFSPNFVYHSGTEEGIGLENLKKQTSEGFSAFPDAHYTIDDMVAEGDKVAVRCTVTGTHKGEFMGIPPTNKKVTVWGISIVRIVGGKLVEEWDSYDMLGWMRQLGPVPTPKAR